MTTEDTEDAEDKIHFTRITRKIADSQIFIDLDPHPSASSAWTEFLRVEPVPSEVEGCLRGESV